MIYVVNTKDELVFKVDAWQTGATDIAKNWVIDNGYEMLSSEITLMGDMIVRVA